MRAKVRYFERSIGQERRSIRWLESRWAPRTLERVSELGWNRRALRWHTALLAQYRAKLDPWPPHHQLWLCIYSGEHGSDRWATNTGNGYFGGMQMHADWGYGTSHHASDDSQLEQEWAAERSLRAAGSGWLTWLWQQWAADAHCFT